MNEVKLTIHTGNGIHEIECAPGATLLSVLTEHGFHPESPCGGKGTCGKCRVTLDPAPAADARELALLPAGEIAKGTRLACRIIVDRNMTVRLREEGSGARILTDGQDAQEVDCAYSWRSVTVPAPRLNAGKTASDTERLASVLPGLTLPLPVLSGLPAALRVEDGAISLLLRDDHVLEIVPGTSSRPLYGVAVDIGTTTIVAYLVELSTGKTLRSASCMNPQRPMGEDVITRMDYARQSERSLAELRDRVRGGIRSLLEEVSRAEGISMRDILEVVLAGNTVMGHLFAGISPENIAVSPFTPAVTERLTLTPAEADLAIHPMGRVTVLPHVASYVGGDIVCSVMASGLDESDDLSLLVDIGTNGEIVLGSRERVLSCSTAAGPALEGAHIRCGLGGVNGAVSHADDDLNLTVIGGGEPRGICGSGLIDIIASLLRRGALLPSGRLDDEEGPEEWEDRWDWEGRSLTLRLSDGDAPVVLCQKDIREVQLAKAAIAAGIEVLVHQFGRNLKDIQHVYLAGGFGTYMNKANACAIGLLPPELLDRIEVIGNGAGTGARMALVSRRNLLRGDALAKRMEFLELSASPDFQDLFMDNMSFGEDE